ncbi:MULTISPECIES: outer membrane lipoprotein carrier protein LolA [Burkholderia]|uniref:outer membrane lipoprotein carrier protein LolA n=1 Tax=Burkholderia TaxID=32008 RepID=UPI000B7A74E8|nr:MULTISPECIES: outer membrane lipoprotein carrier protein LolA [Burkholderia]MBY4722837.1 outer membrane lipoprotein carrier protein LolA [Burkholderia contaminans]MCI3972533.1 outer membrane lipoprotein carrier protein LolA [Burkholderia sp. HI4860]MDN7786849.1 outer membrane lipoprotein carrier protein LolA [Burkholderia contaminans]OXJ01433.1 acyltransferase [Burkholderia sp. AU33647]
MTAVRRCLPTLPSTLHRAVRTLAVAVAAGAAMAALAATPAQPADTAPAWNLDRLMSTLAQHKSGRATFTETKTLSIATQPVESSGELVFVAPDHLEKHTLSPKPEHLVVDGDMLTVERNNRKFTLALARYPELGAFIDSIRATLAGNRFALEQVYKVALAGRGDDWTLTLTPLDSRMLKVVSTITLDGTRDVLRSVAIRQADGDRSVMRLQPVPVNPN